jgi:hypothetical protein
MNKQTELNIACYKLMQAIKSGNRILTNADYDKKWEDFKLRSLKFKNLKRKA